ncbi:hypothetical protein [Candidatus Harpocratesius sp.]
MIKLGLNIKVYVVDQEYYRHNIFKSFKQRNIEVITPTKNYKQLKICKKDYLPNKKVEFSSMNLVR